MKAAVTLENDHQELDALLEVAFSAIENRDKEALHLLLDRFWARLAVHIRAEHKHVFPSLESHHDFETAIGNGVLDPLKTDHDFFMKELASLVSVTSAAKELNLSMIEDRLEAVANRLAAHNKIEESIVYPAISKLLPPSEAEDLQKVVKAELDNMPPRFAAGQ